MDKKIRKRAGDPVLFVVIPVYNEEDVLPLTLPVFLKKLDKLIAEGKVSDKSRLLLVDDGSRDGTGDIIRKMARGGAPLRLITLPVNRGQQRALFTGMMRAQKACDVLITMDCDGQHNIEVLERMLRLYKAGYDMVFGVRKWRLKDQWLKFVLAHCYSGFFRCFGIDLVRGTTDFRLMTATAVKALKGFEHPELFIRGACAAMDCSKAYVFYDELSRAGGVTKYSYSKYLRFAKEGVLFLMKNSEKSRFLTKR